MYKTIIEFKKDTSEEMLGRLKAVCYEAFDNRAGKAVMKEENEYTVSFEGGEALYGCLDLGCLNLKKNQELYHNVASWKWVDESPEDNCDMLKLYAKYMRA